MTPELEVHVGDLLGRPGERRRFRRSIGFDDLGLSTAWIDPGDEVVIDLTLEAILGGLTVAGRVGGLWHGDCRRCLEPVSGEFDVAVQEVFTDQSGDRPTDEDLLPLQGERVDLEPVIREAVLLALPLSPLCARGCRGPAPEDYPTDSVEARIADEEDAGSARDPRWAALDALDFDERD